MIEIEMPKDIRRFKTKLIGPFTLRECICLGLTVGVGYFVRKYLEGMPDDIRSFITLVVVSPFVACGWISPYGLPFEQYAKVIFFTSFLSPKIRKYVTEMEFVDIENINVNEKSGTKDNKSNKKDVKKVSKNYKSKEFDSYK